MVKVIIGRTNIKLDISIIQDKVMEGLVVNSKTKPFVEAISTIT